MEGLVTARRLFPWQMHLHRFSPYPASRPQATTNPTRRDTINRHAIESTEKRLPKMQRDTAMTFREIHGDEETLITNVKLVVRMALTSQEQTERLSLRFLQARAKNGNVVDVDLIKDDVYHLVVSYVAVSYTWDQSHGPSLPEDVPDYRIWDQTSSTPDQPRDLRCPVSVFHRALQFARAHNCARIWIDQECIDQDNLEDIERHLRIMDRVYRESRWTVALLSLNVNSVRTFTALMKMHRHVPRSQRHTTTADCFQAIEYLSVNPYFKRTWTFQERLCSTDLIWLIPCPHEFQMDLNLLSPLAGSDIEIDVDLVLANLLLYVRRDRFEGYGEENFFNLPDIGGRKSAGLLAAPNLFEVSEDCDNSITSDRLAILANVCLLNQKLNSTLLNRPDYSYSTCLLVLMIANHCYSDDIEDFFETSAPGLMDLTVREALNDIWTGRIEPGRFRRLAA